MKLNYLIHPLLFLICFLIGSSVNAIDVKENFTERKVTKEEATTKLRKAIVVLEEMTQAKDKNVVPISLLKKAQAVAVIPDLVEAGLLVGAKMGRGIVVVRNEDGWSDPVFISSSGGSLGLQAGAQSSDIILVFQKRGGVEKMVNTQVTLGVDAAVAAGPIGRSAEASADLQFKSPIYSYSRSAGLFAGVSVEGSVLEIDHAANEGFYGEKISAKDIFDGKTRVTNETVDALKTALAQYTTNKTAPEQTEVEEISSDE